MNLNENWSIRFDENNTILVFKTERLNKKGELVEVKDDFYYPSIKTALTGFLNKTIEGVETAKELLVRIEQVEKIISNIK